LSTQNIESNAAQWLQQPNGSEDHQYKKGFTNQHFLTIKPALSSLKTRYFYNNDHSISGYQHHFKIN